MNRAYIIGGIAAIAAITVFESCKKYEEGPGISFRSREERVANTWRVGKYMEGGLDLTNDEAAYPNDKWIFSRDGDLSVSTVIIGNITVTADGSWDLTNNDERIAYTFTAGSTTTTGNAQILKLKEKEMWLKDEMSTDDPGDDKEFHFVPY